MLAALTGSSPLARATATQPARLDKLQRAEQRSARMFPHVPLLRPEEAQQLLQTQPERVLLLDCRNAEEQQVSVLPGSRVLTAAEFEQQRQQTPPEHNNPLLVCYCTVGYRSARYAADLLAQGRPAANLQGGILAWTHAGLPLVDGRDRRQQQPSSRVHVYAPRCAWQADGCEPVAYTHSSLVMLRDALVALARKLGVQR